MGERDFKQVEMSKLVNDKEMLQKQLDEGLKNREYWDTTLKNISGALSYINQHIAELKAIIDNDVVNTTKTPPALGKMAVSKEETDKK